MSEISSRNWSTFWVILIVVLVGIGLVLFVRDPLVPIWLSILGLIISVTSVVWFAIILKRHRASQRVVPRFVTLGSFNRPDVKEAICANIRANLSLHGDGLAVVGGKKDALLVKWVIDNDYVPKEVLERVVHESICNIGREMFEWHRANPIGNKLDHALSPEALGYAMRWGVLSPEERASIRFDHGETPEKYIQSSTGLFEKVMRQLRDGTAFLDLSWLGLGDDSDICHHCYH